MLPPTPLDTLGSTSFWLTAPRLSGTPPGNFGAVGVSGVLADAYARMLDGARGGVVTAEEVVAVATCAARRAWRPPGLAREDLVHDVVVALLPRAAALPTERGTIEAARLCRQSARRGRRHWQRRAPLVEPSSQDFLPETVGLREALAALAPRVQRILAWRAAGHPIQEIAAQLGLSRRHVTRLLYDAAGALGLCESTSTT